MIVGVNIGANKDAADRIADYAAGVIAFNALASYLVVNVSSPNTPGLRDLQAASELERLLKRVNEARDEAAVKDARRAPLLLKIAPDLGDDELAAIAATAVKAGVDGLIVSNTTITRPPLKSPFAGEEGGLSGRPLFSSVDAAAGLRLCGNRRTAAAYRGGGHFLARGCLAEGPCRGEPGAALLRSCLSRAGTGGGDCRGARGTAQGERLYPHQ